MLFVDITDYSRAVITRFGRHLGSGSWFLGTNLKDVYDFIIQRLRDFEKQQGSVLTRPLFAEFVEHLTYKELIQLNLN